jgi:predicted metal-binding membrane protein
MTASVSSVASTQRQLRHRWMVLIVFACMSAAAWIYVVLQARQMSAGMTSSAMGGGMQSMSQTRVWTAGEFGVMLVMWAVMMVAMMVPSAVPMTLVYAAVARKAAREARPVAPTGTFISGYLAIWALFAVAATAAQMGLDRLSLLSPAITSTSPLLGGALLIGAGVYELTPYKHACLAHCRAPAHFIAQHWQGGFTGAFRMGLALGAYCLGCCWILMGLLFVGGVMNLLWIVAIAAFILFEKTVSFGQTGGRVVGVAMIVVGVAGLTGLIALG